MVHHLAPAPWTSLLPPAQVAASQALVDLVDPGALGALALAEREVLHRHHHPEQLGWVENGGKAGKAGKMEEKFGTMMINGDFFSRSLMVKYNFQGRVADQHFAVSIGHCFCTVYVENVAVSCVVGVCKFEFRGWSWVSGNR